MTDQQTPVVVSPVWESVPAALATRQQWLLWKFEQKEGAAKPGKIPYYVAGGRRTGGQGDDRDRQRLATLDVVRRAYERGGWSGVGFAFLPGDGLIGIDIDGAIDPASGVVSDRCAAIIKACNSFTEYSPSGKGVHIIVEGHTTTNKSNDIGLEVFCERQFFTFTANRYPDTPADVQAIDAGVLNRLHATIDEAKAKRANTPRTVPAESPASGAAAQREPSTESPAQLRARVESALQAVSPDIGYNDWISIGWALHSAFGDFGFGLWNAWSAGSGKYAGEHALQGHWRSFKPSTKPVDESVGVIFKRAYEAGWKPPKPPQRAKPKNANGQAPAGGGDNAPPPGGPGGGDVPPSAGDDDEVDVFSHLVKNRGRPLDCRENVMYCLQLDPELKGLCKQNDFTHLLERSRTTPWGHEAGEWNEEDDLMLGEFMLRKHGLGIKATSTLRNGVLMAARSAKYNPVLDLIHAEKWDGIERLEHWISDVYEVEERPYTRLIGKCFIMGLVKRALQPGCKFDYMLIIKGEQGLKKSTAFRALAYPYFTDNAIRMGDKDSLMAMQLVWIAESAELESLNKSETTQIKQFLSAQEDMFRPPYGSQLIRAKRHSVNVGTTNADEFLKDATGDRRFWPLEVRHVNEDTLSGMRLQLFAEALHRLDAGERYWPSKEEERDLVFPEQAPFKRTDTWEDIIDAYVNRDTPDRHDDPNAPVNSKRDFFPRSEIYERALLIKADRIDGSGNMDTRIGNAMKALGFDKHRETAGKRRRGFMRRPPPLVQAAPLSPPVGPHEAAVPDSYYSEASEEHDLPL